MKIPIKMVILVTTDHVFEVVCAIRWVYFRSEVKKCKV